ncbi:type II toxin-antitoxin system YafQ family toxin [Succinivibrio dextrinosolvens]|jgi:mRNA interferase YafQ|uniref:type II toxin-antitoxin system RelE/ParE family toxin n=1 Tax=Succinivibrio dextrinosolvens TaxID=83771 RepID=UPI0019249C0C|nr:type II toxin-antitoxin system YafQ family toxin [Succinivibrio dextrinosolvens]
MLKIIPTRQFKKDLKLLKNNNNDLQTLKNVISVLQKEHSLHGLFNDHALRGNYKDYRECHIKPDLLLIYRIENDKLILILKRVGSHSELF